MRQQSICIRIQINTCVVDKMTLIISTLKIFSFDNKRRVVLQRFLCKVYLNISLTQRGVKKDTITVDKPMLLIYNFNI